jgi:hypothetical protein
MAILQVTIPNIKAAAQGAAMTTILGKTFANGKPMPVVDNKDVGLVGAAPTYLGVPALTNLELRVDGTMLVLDDCIMTVTQEKNIVETKLQGRNGTVKEYVSDGDYLIDVQASIGGYFVEQKDIEDEYPLAEFKALMDLLKKQKTIEVASDWLLLFDIKSIVIKSYGFAQETHSNVQSFSMQMLSDEPYEIKLMQDA